MIKRVSQRDVIGKLLKDNNMPDTPTARAIYRKMLERDDDDDTQVYRKPWVGLTEEEVSKIIDAEIGFNSCWGPEESFARAIEAKLKEKNT